MYASIVYVSRVRWFRTRVAEIIGRRDIDEDEEKLVINHGIYE